MLAPPDWERFQHLDQCHLRYLLPFHDRLDDFGDENRRPLPEIFRRSPPLAWAER